MKILKLLVVVQAIASATLIFWALAAQNGLVGLGIVMMMTTAVSFLAAYGEPTKTSTATSADKRQNESGTTPNPKAAFRRDFQ